MSAEKAGDSGVTLVELILTIAILCIAVVTIVGGVFTSVLDSDYNHKQADAAAILRSYADAVVALPYQACSAAYSPGYTVPAGYAASILSTEYWDAATSAFIATCPSSDYGFERLTLQVASTDSRAREVLQVEKRIQIAGQTP